MDWIDELFEDPRANQSWCVSLSYLVGLTSLTDREKTDLVKELEQGVTEVRAYEIKAHAERHMICPIQAGSNYNQKDINKALDSKMLDEKA